MKKQLTVALGLAVVCAPAFATKARLEALGEDNYGSYYINDNRNIFLNPARINDNKDLVTFEFGAAGVGGSSSDAANAPRSEGGFTKSHGNLVYGLHFGNSTPTVALIRGLSGGALHERQPWDLFVGGDAGVKWGANITYENYSAGTIGSTGRIDSNSLRTRLGVVMGDIDLFTHISLANKAQNYQGQSVEGDLGYLVGASTMVSNYKLFAEWRQVGAEYRGAATTAGAKQDIDHTLAKIGAGRQERLNDKATLFAKLQLLRQVFEDDGGGVGATLAGRSDPNAYTGAGDVTSYEVPLNVGLEYAATSWLDLRASISQNLWSTIEVDPKASKKFEGRIANTAVRAGASLKFGEFAIDGLISTDGNGDGAWENAGGQISNPNTASSTNSGNGVLRTDNLMSRVSMIYRF